MVISTTRAAESTNFERLRLRPENIDSHSSSDSASTPIEQQLFHPKKSDMMWSFLDAHFDNIQKGDKVIHRPFALTAEAADSGYG